MSDTTIKNVVEAALLAAGRPLDVEQLRELFEEFARPEPSQVRAALKALAAEYEDRGIELKEVASGFRIQVRGVVAAEVSRLWLERPQRYSRALLETLALIAYRQPITRGEIEDVRGVQVNPNIIRTLLERNWVRVIGHRDVPGHPELLATTREFLDYFGLKTLDDLPTLSELRDVETLGVQLEFAATREDAPPAPLGSADGGDGGETAETAVDAAGDEDGEREFAGPDGAKAPFAAKAPGD
jgi:segregation and condensation protein B